ncbi:MEMBRANE-ASSOCIATED KINASE REGULATOR 2-RELATED [Salix purpurea]|uniref:MEMBRANE-ASSOCIATED KINASE REGULATOR 2-RELATED n=1 Tax=Salix purpurea TaxID=77065 RepID=A0A9Q1A702_SALPP|nr:MEMBRANE-ASSOCIATED KINASE REGULATOR 2-RELATED [Salix purpurea]
MEALYFLKFWRPTTAAADKENRPSSGSCDDTTEIPFTDCEFEEGEDSFFELELTVPDFDTSKCGRDSTTNIKNSHPLGKESNFFDSKQASLHNLAHKESHNPQHTFQQPSLSTDHLVSKRKILPVEHVSSTKPQSPISLLKSAPRFRVLMFKKPKSMASQKTEKTGEAEQFNANSKRHESNKLFTVKFKLEEVANASFFTKQNSLRKQIAKDSYDNDTSKRFSKEMIQKYLKLIKPLYIRVSKKQNDKMKFSGELSAGSPSSSPASVPAKEKQGNFSAGIRVVSRHLGKSKSASATTGISPPIGSRRDDSLLLQNDGIQSAILHCKKSFNSSRDSSSMSSETLLEKSMASPRISSSEENATN